VQGAAEVMTSSTPDLSMSVVVLCRNHSRYIQYCVRSIFAADQECELIFVDNASTDDSVEVARALLATAPPLVTCKLVALDPERSINRALNIGHDESRGSAFVKPISADDELGPNFFPAFRKLATTTDPRIGLWMAGSAIIDSEERVLRQTYSPTLFGSPDDGPAQPYEERHLLHSPLAPKCTSVSMFYRRQAYTEAGGFDERFRYDDRPFLFNLLKVGWKIAVYPFNNTYYRVHDEAISRDAAWMAEARLPILVDHTRRAEWRNKPYALYHLARNLRVVAKDRWRKWRSSR
jgi:glycosyltransferase involved in cell wall biosynthesis